VSDQHNFSSPPHGHSLSLKVEADETEGDAKVRRVKDLALFFSALIAVAIVLGLCLWVAIASPSADDKRWSTSILTAIVGGLVGYLVKK
jgi:uncharacterized protein (DUF983 family)